MTSKLFKKKDIDKWQNMIGAARKHKNKQISKKNGSDEREKATHNCIKILIRK